MKKTTKTQTAHKKKKTVLELTNQKKWKWSFFTIKHHTSAKTFVDKISNKTKESRHLLGKWQVKSPKDDRRTKFLSETKEEFVSPILFE